VNVLKASAVPLGRKNPQKRATSHGFVPYVYKKSEVTTLLDVAGHETAWPNPKIESTTFRMILLLLYATGASQAELLTLKRQDVQLGTRMILLRNAQYKTSRHIPVSGALRNLIAEYMVWRFARIGDCMFITSNERRLSTSDLLRRFKILCRETGVSRTDGHTARPRLSDFRHTFAVHRITTWIEQGLDLNVTLPALAAYMGSASLLSGERYLRMTPERFRKHLDSLSPAQGKTHWKDDSELMTLLGTFNGRVRPTL